MEIFRYAFNAFYKIVNIPIDLFGYTISLWAIFLFALIGGFVMWILREIFSN